MKVAELINLLKNQDPEKIAIIPGYEGGFNEVSQVKQVEVCGPVEREWYYGKYDYCNMVKSPEKKNAILLIK
jgi:hypothetical protein